MPLDPTVEGSEGVKMTMYNPNSAHAVSHGKLGTSARFESLAREAEEAARSKYWSDFGWTEEDGDVPPPEYLKFVAERRAAARVLREKAEGLRRNGY